MKGMKKSAVLAGLLLLLPMAARAQATPKGELGLGYSMLRLSNERTTTHGWDAALAGNINPNLAIVFDFAGHYGNYDETVNAFGDSLRVDVQSHSAMIGPKVMQTVGGRWTPFAQVLVGVARTNLDFRYASTFTGTELNSETETGVAVTLGGGLDYIASPNVAIRLFQAEYAFLKFPAGGANVHEQGARVGAGIVFRFGRR
jgi:opacity protein-like surface antigen